MKQYLTPRMINCITYLTFVIFMLIVNAMLLVPFVLGQFTIQTYAFFTFKTLIGIDAIGSIIFIMRKLDIYNGWLSILNMLVIFVSGLALPYLWVSIIRIMIIVWQLFVIREIYYNILYEYKDVTDDLIKAAQKKSGGE